MHKTSFNHMAQKLAIYLDSSAELTIADVGSRRVSERSRCYKDLITPPNWTYLGVDIEPGENVDVVMEKEYEIPLDEESVDVILCGQVFEHVEFFWLTWAEFVRILKPGGLIILIVPSRGYEHKYPVDCWRFYPDGLRALAKLGELDLVEVSTDGLLQEPQKGMSLLRRIYDLASHVLKLYFFTSKYYWGDTVGVFRKPIMGQPQYDTT